LSDQCELFPLQSHTTSHHIVASMAWDRQAVGLNFAAEKSMSATAYHVASAQWLAAPVRNPIL
jgi:hypothetical protein